MKKHFCTCTDLACPLHPENHEKGCDLCIEKNLRQREMPTCFFLSVSKDIDEVTEFTVEGFVDFYLKHKTLKNKEVTL